MSRWGILLIQATAISGVFLTASCSTQHLADEQKNQVRELLASLAVVQSTPKQASQNNNASAQASTIIADKIDDKCKVSYSSPKGSPDLLGLASANASIDGTNCPVQLSFVADLKTKEAIFTKLDLSYHYKVLDETLKSQTDLTELHLSGSYQAENSDQIKGTKASFNGIVQSQKFGTIPLSLSVTQEADTTESKIILDFPGFRAELSKSVSEDGDSYSINKESIEKSEFEAYVKVP